MKGVSMTKKQPQRSQRYQICVLVMAALAGAVTLSGCSHNSVMTSRAKPGSSSTSVSQPPRTKEQNLGLTIARALHQAPKVAKANISVGTSADTVTLDGKVPT